MSEERPLASIIVRTKDRPQLLKRALRSIAAQTYRPIEVILVNDGGCSLDTGELQSVLGDIFLNYVMLENNTGRAHAANVGIANAQGTCIGFLDDDDEFYPRHVESLCKHLLDGNVKVCYSDCEIRKVRYNPETGSLIVLSTEPFLSYDFDLSHLLFSNYIPLICTFFDRVLFDTAGRFDESFELYEDWDLLIRAGMVYNFSHVSETTAIYNKWSTIEQMTQSATGADSTKDRFYHRKITEKYRPEHNADFFYRIYELYNHLSSKYCSELIHATSLENRNELLQEEKARLENMEVEFRKVTETLRARNGELEERNTRLQEEKARLEDMEAALRKETEALRARNGELEERNTRLEGEKASLQNEVGRLESEETVRAGVLKDREERMRLLEEKNAQLSSLISRIYGSRGWRLLSKYYGVKEFILGTPDQPSLSEKTRDFLKKIAKRFLSKKVQIYLKLLLYRLSSGSKIEERLDRGPTKRPFISIVIPVYNRGAFVRQALESALNQDYDKYEVVAVDDFSKELEVREILTELSERYPRFKVLHNETNRGISESLNRAIIWANGDYVAFLDCDDFLPEYALKRAAEAISENPGQGYFFSDRINVDVGGKEIERISFVNRKRDNYLRELMRGMFTDHLKVVHRGAFLEAGLLDNRYDSVQDYDFALRYAFRYPAGFWYINDFLYFHRVYPEQISSQKAELQRSLAEDAKKATTLRVAINKGKSSRRVSIIILSFNKREHTLRCVRSIKETVRGNYEIILFDNGSHPETVDLLRKSFSNDERVRAFFSPDNLGCPKGRKKAISYADGDYVVTLDNDIVVTPGWIEELVVRVEEDPSIAGACCRIIFPDNRIQYNGGTAAIRDGFVEFSLVDAWKDGNDVSTMRKCDCDWIPGGATLYRREVYEKNSICEEFENAYEDNDFSFSVKKLGYRLVNCPTAKVIHYHVMYDQKSALREKEYMDHRYSHEALKRSVVAFYRRQGLIIKDEYVYKVFGFNGVGEDAIRKKFAALAEAVHAQ